MTNGLVTCLQPGGWHCSSLFQPLKTMHVGGLATLVWP